MIKQRIINAQYNYIDQETYRRRRQKINLLTQTVNENFYSGGGEYTNVRKIGTIKKLHQIVGY